MNADERLAAVHRPTEVWEPPGNMIGWCCACGWGSEGGYDLPSVEAHIAAVLRDAGWVDPATHERSLDAMYEQGVSHGRQEVRADVAGAREYVHDAIDPPNQFITYYDLVDAALAAVTDHLGGDDRG